MKFFLIFEGMISKKDFDFKMQEIDGCDIEDDLNES